METYFATCAKGLEPLLHQELRALKVARSERQVGGVRFDGDWKSVWRANLELFTANRVLWRLARFPAGNADELYRGAAELDWTRFLPPGATLAVRATCAQSQLDHTQFVAQRVKDAVVDQLRERRGERPDVDLEDADLWLHAHLARDVCTLSLDTSGEPLYKRGWRRVQGRAPLAETLAAALVRFSGWDRRAPLVDPFAGSGTILVEAALWAGGFAPGRFGRAFAFERLPEHDAAAFEGYARPIRQRGELPKKLRLLGWEADPKAVEGARENIEAAGFAGRIEIECSRAEDWEPPRGWNAWIVSNLPYGERVGEARAVERSYRDFAARVLARAAGYRVALLTAKGPLTQLLGLPGATRLALANGGIACELLVAGLE
jgi:23S rRNA G2445 N2-methylase RlmL